MSVGPCLYGFKLDRAREEAVLVHILYSHKKTGLLNNLCTGYEILKIVRYFVRIYCVLISL